MDFKIYAPTYKRAELCKTHNYLSEVIYVVRESEKDDYFDTHDKLWIVPDSAQGNLSRIRITYWIIPITKMWFFLMTI